MITFPRNLHFITLGYSMINLYHLNKMSLQNSIKYPEKSQFLVFKESLDQKGQYPQYGSAIMESGSLDELVDFIPFPSLKESLTNKF